VKLKYHPFILFVLLAIWAMSLFSCRRENKKQESSFAPTVVEAKGYVISEDSVAEPIIIPVNENKLIKVTAGKSKQTATNTNPRPVGVPVIVLAGIPKI
jgi:hypothetical protein